MHRTSLAIFVMDKERNRGERERVEENKEGEEEEE
jgi:hypothetical protein